MLELLVLISLELILIRGIKMQIGKTMSISPDRSMTGQYPIICQDEEEVIITEGVQFVECLLIGVVCSQEIQIIGEARTVTGGERMQTGAATQTEARSIKEFLTIGKSVNRIQVRVKQPHDYMVRRTH